MYNKIIINKIKFIIFPNIKAEGIIKIRKARILFKLKIFIFILLTFVSKTNKINKKYINNHSKNY